MYILENTNIVWDNLKKIYYKDIELDSVAKGSTVLWSAFRPLEYLQSTGTQIIVTDLMPSSSKQYELDVQFTASTGGSGYRGFFGCRRTRSGVLYTIFSCNFGVPADTVFYGYLYHTASNGAEANISSSLKTNRNTLSVYNQTVTYGGSVLLNVTVTDPTDMDLPLALFGIVNGESSSDILPYADSQMSLYGFKVYDNNTLTHNLIPVERRADNELGLYDTITNKFYTNAGTGTFIKGNYI